MKCNKCDKPAHYTPIVLVWAKNDPQRERAVARVELDYPLCEEHASELIKNPDMVDCTGEALTKVTQQLTAATEAYWELKALENKAGKGNTVIPDPIPAVEPDLERKVVQMQGNYKRPLPYSLAYLRLPPAYRNPIVSRAMALAHDVTHDPILAAAVAVRFYNVPEEQRLRGKGRLAKKILKELQDGDVDLEKMIEEEVKVRS